MIKGQNGNLTKKFKEQFFLFSISSSDFHGLGPAHCGTCTDWALGLDLTGSHVE